MDSNQNDQSQLLRKKDVANMLACSLRTVDREASGGRLPRVKVRGGVRFRRCDVERMINGGGCD
jgi:excisionase family DNA binding protein